jgi:hypothetical protein
MANNSNFDWSADFDDYGNVILTHRNGFIIVARINGEATKELKERICPTITQKKLNGRTLRHRLSAEKPGIEQEPRLRKPVRFTREMVRKSIIKASIEQDH